MDEPEKESKKVSTTVYLTLEQVHSLRILNQKTKVPIAEFVREGIDLVLEQYKDLLPGQIMLIPEEASPPVSRLAVRTAPPHARDILEVGIKEDSIEL